MQTTEICPSCGGTAVGVVYGMPNQELMAAASACLVALGGCMMFPGGPTWKCRKCGNSGTDRPDS